MCDSVFPNTWGIDNEEPLFPFNSGNINTPVNPFTRNTAGFPKFPSDHDFLSLTTKEIGNKYYNNNTILEKKDGVTVYVDPEQDLETILLNEIVIENNRFYKQFNDLEIVLFVGSDGARLLEQYQSTEVSSKELALFLEIDDSTNFFGSVMRIKIGSDAKNMKGLPFNEISRFIASKKVDLNPKQVQDFINGGIKEGKGGILKFLMKVLSGTLQVTSYIFDGLGTFFDKTIPEKLDFFRINDDSWNGDSLLFFPDTIIESLKTARADKSDKAVEKALNPFYKMLDKVCNTAENCADLLKPFFPKQVFQRVKSVIEMITEHVSNIRKYIKENSSLFLDMLITAIKMVNAMLCGFLNSMVDFIKGIFQIIGIIFKITAEILDIADNIGFYTEYISEIIENFISAVVAIDYAAFFKELIQAPVKLYESISAFIKSGIDLKMDWVSAAYYYGYIAGLIIQIIAEILLTGGTLTIAKIAEYFKAPFVAVGNIIKTSVGAAKSLFQKVLNFINYLVGKLKNPKQLLDDFIKFVDELLKGTKKEAGIPETITEQDLLGNWDNVSGRSRRLGQKLTEKDIKKLILHLKKINYELEIFPKNGSFPVKDFFANGLPSIFEDGAQAAFIYTNKRGKLLLREEATIYEVFHELMHVNHSKSIGLQKYAEMGGRYSAGELVKEEFVFFKIIDNKDLFTREELESALNYINRDIYYDRGIDPISFDFDINKIPLVRKEVKIDRIFNIK